MQSGITASQELQDAFKTLVSSFPAQRGLIVSIRGEQLVPIASLETSTTDFYSELSALQSHLKDNEAAYIILRRYDDAPDGGFVAVTYVPDTAPVRQKMLFASTRLTLTREFGIERCREMVFATTREDLTADGWRKHEAHGRLSAPLTEEEQSLKGVKEAEAEASRGTGVRTTHLSGHTSLKIGEGAVEALQGLKDESKPNLVQLRIDISTEVVELVSATSVDAKDLASKISSTEPRYSVFRYAHSFEGEARHAIIFLYTCPSESKVKEKMVYASFRGGAIKTVEAVADITVAKKLEATMPEEITAQTLDEELHPKADSRQTFTRPKRPGK